MSHRVKVVTIDFWDTLYRHCRTAEYRKQVRKASLLEYCHRFEIESPEMVADTAFTVIDTFIKNSWKEGVWPSPKAVIEHVEEAFERRYSKKVLEEIIQEINRIYTAILRPELFLGAAEFLHWAKELMSIYLISDTYTIRGETLLARSATAWR